MLKLIVLLLIAAAALFSLRLLWLRLLSGWRTALGGQAGSTRQRSSAGSARSTMDRQQALDVLGLSGTPSRQDVIDAHRRLMQKLHPDRGGSTYLAQQLNDAKRVLLQSL